MGSIPPELSLDLRPSYVPKTINDFLGGISTIGDVSERVMKLDEFLKRLEEEMRKIDAFKRELPLCMILLGDAILALKEELMRAKASNVQPVLEEFIPLKKDCDEDGGIKKEKDCKDKKNWMSSVQLWNSDDPASTDHIHDKKQEAKPEIKQRLDEENRPATEDPFQPCKSRTGGRAFLPFKAYSGFPVTSARKEEKDELSVHGLSLLTPGIKNPREESTSSGSKTSCSRAAVSSSAPNLQSNLRTGPQPPQQQTARKQRRCWSPELHRRFVNALQQLGGSQAATPKQIRELMQVDGLTNDEVKSHLQKYRLHTRRMPNASATPTSNQPVVVLGSLWMTQDQYGDSSKASSSQSASPQGPLQLGGAAGGTSTTGGDSMEDDEDEKSESYSWKSQVHKSGKEDV